MRKLIQLMSVVMIALISTSLYAQDPDTVTIRDLNFYENLTELSADSLQAHPLIGETVIFTAVITSYPASSGLATPSDSDGDGVLDDIGRVHVFVTDTSANSMGRDGMSMQIVESDFTLIDSYNRGDVVTFIGDLGFFNATAQFDLTDTPVLLGNVNDDPQLAPYASLLEPWVVTLDEINSFDQASNTQAGVPGNYAKYNGAYVKIEGGVVTNVTLGNRPSFAVTAAGSRMYTYDTSLRYRNDRAEYIPSYNFRRPVDGDYEPPSPGSIVNLSGFLSLNGAPVDGTDGEGESFLINLFEDGILWLNETRFADGEDLGGGLILDWPNDLELVGAPPVFSEVSLSDSTITSSDAVTVSVTVVGVEGATINSVDLIYTAGTTTDTLSMSASGDVYSATLPTFDNFTPVSFYFVAEDSEGLVGREPIAGAYGFFVQDGAINSISLIQQTGDGQPGASPLAGAGALEMDITGTIVSDANDGVIIVQDNAAEWGGIFLEQTSATSELNRGDVINIVNATVIEASVASNSNTLTQLTDLEFSVVSSGNDIEAVIPTITTDMVVAMQVGSELEPYEGMVVRFENVQVVDRGNFGEYTFRNVDADSADGAIFNEDIRSNDQIGTVGVPFDINHSIRMNKPMTAYAVVAGSFGAPKFHPRDVNDFVTTDDNAFTPVLDFPLTAPLDSSTVEVTGDIQVTWSATEDFDGDDVTYEWVLYSADTVSVVVALPSNNDGADAVITIPGTAVDDLLAGAGLEVGQSADFVWNVRVSDGSDTLDVHGSYGNFGDDFAPIYRFITLTRGVITNNETDFGTPKVFSLEQNYPNPFNPSTNINFSLPQASRVSLKVYDMLGREVATLINGEQMTAANHTVNFNASALASGMYIYRIEAGSFVSTKKMMLIK